MGNTESCGYGVLNLSTVNLNVGFSMGATHYYENSLKYGEVCYRWPGAVFYSIYAYGDTGKNRITDNQCANEILAIAVPSLLAAAAVAGAVVALIYCPSVF